MLMVPSARVYLPHAKRDIEPRRLLRLTRVLTVVFGISQMAVAMSGPWGGDVISGVLAIASVTTGITLGLFLLGIIDRKAGERAALIALQFSSGASVTLPDRTVGHSPVLL